MIFAFFIKLLCLLCWPTLWAAAANAVLRTLGALLRTINFLMVSKITLALEVALQITKLKMIKRMLYKTLIIQIRSI